jgi:hypothetical protein
VFSSSNRALVNFAHSGSVSDRRWDDEGKPCCFLYVMFVSEWRTEQEGPVRVIFHRKPFSAKENSPCRLLFRRSTWLGISCRLGLMPSTVASASLSRRWQQSSSWSSSGLSFSSFRNSDTHRAQSMFSMAHNSVLVTGAPIRHSLPGTFLIGLMHTILVTIVEWVKWRGCNGRHDP